MSIKYNNKSYNLYRIGKLLRAERKKQGLNLSDLQEKTKIVKSRLSYLENAKVKAPSIDHFLKIIEALNINEAVIFNEYTEEKDMAEQIFHIHITSIRSKLQIGEFETARKELSILKKQLGKNSRFASYILKLCGDYYYAVNSFQNALDKYSETSKLLERDELQNLLYFDVQISLNNALYQMRRTSEALHNNISLIRKLQTISYKNKTENYASYMVRVYFNIALCYIKIFEIDRAHEVLHLALTLTKTLNESIEAAYSYFMAIIMYYKGDIKESQKYFFQAVQDIQKKNDPKLIAKSISAMHALGLLESDHFGLNLIIGEHQYFYHECDDICRKEKSFHRAFNNLIKDYLSKGKDIEAMTIIQQLQKYGHSNTMTKFHHAVLISKTNPESAKELLKQIMEVIENDDELYAYEKSYIISTYLNSIQKHDRLHSILHKQIEEVYLGKCNQVIIELLPEPLN